MDNVASEVSKKVKSAIKAKLTEIGAYVDDELPDYIMVLVANRKTKDQMDEDLSLFLGHNTERFTSWLHVVLQKLNAAAVLQVKKEGDESPPEVSRPPTPPPAEDKKEVKEPKKKKDKKEKKKDKKEKKKKKEKKEKKSKGEKEKEKAKSISPGPENIKICVVNEKATENETEESTSVVSKVSETQSNEKVTESPVEETEATTTIPNENEKDQDEDDELLEDVVDLRTDADDLALYLEEESTTVVKSKVEAKKRVREEEPMCPKKLKPDVPDPPRESNLAKYMPLYCKMIKNTSQPKETTEPAKVSVHDRLGPAVRRIINITPESDPPVIKSVVSNPNSELVPDQPSKKLEARVRPLVARKVSSDDEESEENVTPRVVSTVGAVLKRSHSDSEDNDELVSKKISGIASKVEVAPRPKRSGVQANTALILRAVADAHKSVSKIVKKVPEDKEDDSSNKKKELFTKSYQERQKQRLTFPSSDVKTVKKIAITVPNAVKREQVSNMKDNLDIKTVDNTKAYMKDESEELYDPKPMTVLDTETMDDIDLMDVQREDSYYKEVNAKAKIIPMQTDSLNTNNPRFIVTLDGYDTEPPTQKLRCTKKPLNAMDEEEFFEEVEEWEEVEEMDTLNPEQNLHGTATGAASAAVSSKSPIKGGENVAKIPERCRFWPVCKEGDACSYIHPSKMCIKFPNCVFANKCIYIHPNCKFDAACTRPNCPFTHASARAASIPVPSKVPAGLPTPKIKCRYYPKCVDMNCPFFHPKQICRFGKGCHTICCPYIHPDIATGRKLKWIAPKAPSSVSATAPSNTVTTESAATVS